MENLKPESLLSGYTPVTLSTGQQGQAYALASPRIRALLSVSASQGRMVNPLMMN
jgi:hypothetical protein